MGALPDLEMIRTHVEESYHFSSWNRYVHPDDQDLRRRHVEAHTTGKVRDGHTHANLQRPFAESTPVRDWVMLALDEGGHVIGAYRNGKEALECLGFDSADVAAEEGIQLQEWELEKPGTV